jgi:hypothetical protein
MIALHKQKLMERKGKERKSHRGFGISYKEFIKRINI